MIWLIGSKGMLGTDVGAALALSGVDFFASDKEIDITNLSQLKNTVNTIKDISWIINCAAYTAVEKAENDPNTAFKLNADGAANLACIAKDCRAKLIHISTDYVFDGKKDKPYVEDDPPHPTNVYGATKLAGEESIQKIYNNHFIIRTAWLYGKNGTNFVNTMIRLFAIKDEVRVVSDQIGSPTYSKDLSSAILKIVQTDSEKYGLYHFTNEGATSWYDFAKEIQDEALKGGLINKKVPILPIRTAEYQSNLKRPANSCLSKEKFKKTFDIKIRNWKIALKDYLAQLS